MKNSVRSGAVVWRLLRRNISVGQLLGYALANFVGLAIVLTALQFYRDVTSDTSGADSFIRSDYLIISKEVDGVSFDGGESHSFTAAERDSIAAQPWADRVGEFTAANFNVGASVDMGGRGMSTFLFLESIPDEYFDVQPRGWSDFDPSDSASVVPIIISKDYLTLYNFGFATSRGLPQISETMIGAVPLRLSLSGNGRQRYVDARIVGFSSRLNTIAVPERFMQWANDEFSDRRAPAPSRLIIKVNSPGDPAVQQYLADHHYEPAGDKLDNGRAARFLAVVTSVVIGVGLIISLLAFFILLLSIYLLLQKNRRTISDLILLGYTPRQISTHYYIIVGAVNCAVILLSIAVMLAGARAWREPLADLGLEPSSPWVSVLTGAVVIAGVTALNFLAISRTVSRTAR